MKLKKQFNKVNDVKEIVARNQDVIDALKKLNKRISKDNSSNNSVDIKNSGNNDVKFGDL